MKESPTDTVEFHHFRKQLAHMTESFKFQRNTALLAACFLISFPVFTDDARDKRQAELDAACEEAREKLLTPIRDNLVEQCVRKGEQDTREDCQAYYADYGARAGSRAPLFYDLPACVASFEYQQSERSSE